MKGTCPLRLSRRPKETTENVTDPQGAGPRPSIGCGLPLPSFQKKDRDKNDWTREEIRERTQEGDGDGTERNKSAGAPQSAPPKPATTKPASTGDGSFWLEGLPSELICRILACLTSPKDLNSAVQSSRTILQHYLSDRKRILASVLLPSVHSSPAACAYLSRYQPPLLSSLRGPETLALLPILEALDRCGGVPRDLRDVLCEGCAYAVSVADLHGAVVAPLSREYPDLNFPDRNRSAFEHADGGGRKLVRDMYGRVYMRRVGYSQEDSE